MANLRAIVGRLIKYLISKVKGESRNLPGAALRERMAKLDEAQQIIAARGLATHQIARIEANLAAGNEQLIKTAHWLNTALLAINGGGAIATLNSAPDLVTPAIPATAFALGIIFCLLSGVAIQSAHSRRSMPAEHLLFYWRAVEMEGYYDTDEEEEFLVPYREASRLSWLCPALGWVSGCLFLCGVALLTLGFNHPK